MAVQFSIHVEPAADAADDHEWRRLIQRVCAAVDAEIAQLPLSPSPSGADPSASAAEVSIAANWVCLTVTHPRVDLDGQQNLMSAAAAVIAMARDR